MENNQSKPHLKNTQKNMDNPEQYPTDKESLFDKFESERNVDPIPLEDLKEEKREEKAKYHTKDSSSSDKKYKTGFGDTVNHN